MTATPHTNTDVILVALAKLLGTRTDIRDAFLADQTPAIREQYWADVTEAQTRIGL
ncbi:hypothetical protein [Nonomuraea cavernae]|uniref:Uncharacterized protein n=1 Tax=Nonomuraea cavernae TaxID=2045107 RepID=A0A917Z1T8_9ACTN|nr:hypothetical protein [Nonomuraea cavernae]MCA2190475.1 hypothetical protein [Nonomuraea cavernae]GGO70621.1 hypothetical protein GCM10012289_34450 [Nonomuraea cavernae]